MLIRKATAADCEGIRQAHTRAIREVCSSHYLAAQIELWAGWPRDEHYAQAMSQREFVVAVKEEAIAGFGVLHLEGAEVEAVYVHPERMGRGVGCALLEHLEETARAAGLKSLHLTATLNAVTFYQRHGYRAARPVMHEHPSGARLPCVHMEKDLAAGDAEASGGEK